MSTVTEASNEIVSILAKKWGVNMVGPVPEVEVAVQRVVDERLEAYRAEFVPDVPKFTTPIVPDEDVAEPGILAAGPLPKKK